MAKASTLASYVFSSQWYLCRCYLSATEAKLSWHQLILLSSNLHASWPAESPAQQQDSLRQKVKAGLPLWEGAEDTTKHLKDNQCVFLFAILEFDSSRYHDQLPLHSPAPCAFHPSTVSYTVQSLDTEAKDIFLKFLDYRIGGQGASKSWHFVKDHNPVWAARVFGRGIKRVSLAVPRPIWQRDQPGLSRHASAVSVHVRNAWKNRPAMPRPHYRLKQQAVQQRSLMQYVDVAIFYILAVRYMPHCKSHLHASLQEISKAFRSCLRSPI